MLPLQLQFQRLWGCASLLNQFINKIHFLLQIDVYHIFSNFKEKYLVFHSVYQNLNLINLRFSGIAVNDFPALTAFTKSGATSMEIKGRLNGKGLTINELNPILQEVGVIKFAQDIYEQQSHAPAVNINPMLFRVK